MAGITRFIDVVITKDSPGVSAAGFGIKMCITDSDLITTSTRIKSFSTVTAVETFFGEDSEEWKYADAFFNQDPFNDNHPEELQFGRFVTDPIAGVLECGNEPIALTAWQAITDGEFQVTLDGGSADNVAGLNFSAVTSLDDVATIITAGLAAGTCTWDQVSRFVITSGSTGASSAVALLTTVAAPAGTDISGAGTSDGLDGDVAKSGANPGGAIISAGQIAEDFEDALQAIRDVDDSWYEMGALKIFRDTSDAEDMADEIESLRKTFGIASNDSNTLVSGDTSTFSYYLKNANYKRTYTIYHDNATLYPDASWSGQQIPKDVGSTNWAYQTLAGIAEGATYAIPAVSLTEDQITNALSVNCNLYTNTLGADFTYFGTMGGGKNADKEGEFIDVIRNIDFLQARVEEGLLSLLLEKDVIPFTDGGISMADNRLKSLLDTYGVKQGILVEGSVLTYFPKRSDVSSTDRDDRILPDGEFTAELAGGINTIIVRGVVYV